MTETLVAGGVAAGLPWSSPPRAVSHERNALFRPKRASQFQGVYRKDGSSKYRIRLRLFKHSEAGGRQGCYASLPGLYATVGGAVDALAMWLRAVYGDDWTTTAFKPNGRLKPPVVVAELSSGRWVATWMWEGRRRAADGPSADGCFSTRTAALSAAEVQWFRKALPGSKWGQMPRTQWFPPLKQVP